MKMYTFPSETSQPVQELLSERPVVSHAFDAAIARFGLVLMAWAAGACAAIVLAHIG